MRATTRAVILCATTLAMAGQLDLARAAAAPAQREPGIPKELLTRMGDWGEGYATLLPAYSAIETTEETRWDRRGRSTTTKLVPARYQFQRNQDGQIVESRQAIAEATPAGNPARKPAPVSPDQFAKLGLLVTRIGSQYHSRMKYFFALENTDLPTDAVLIGYRQIAGEGLMVVGNKAVYPFGRAWVNPENGSVERIEEEFEVKNTRYWIGVDLEWDAGLQARVPVRIVVRTFEKGHLEVQHAYSYSDFRPMGN